LFEQFLVDDNRRNLQTFLSHQELAAVSVEADEGNGELYIQVPPIYQQKLKEGKHCKVAIEFMVERPDGGLQFINSLYKDKTSFDSLATIDHNSCYWFPCVQSYNELCTWKLEITISDPNLIVIASGHLVEIEQINSVSKSTSNDVFQLPKTFNVNTIFNCIFPRLSILGFNLCVVGSVPPPLQKIKQSIMTFSLAKPILPAFIYQWKKN
jgi:hypothetical protein